MHPRSLSIHDFNYTLPLDRIAHYPLPERDASKLLIFKQKDIHEDIYRNIASYLPSNSLLIFNNTKVIEARLLFQKATGAIVEIFCLEPHPQYPDITTAMAQKNSVVWLCLIGGASKWKAGQILQKNISIGGLDVALHAKYLSKYADSFAIELSWTPGHFSFAEIVHAAGVIPLPPYIKRKPDKDDNERYQTIYAAVDGSVAAPTAGLHFTQSVFKSLAEKNIRTHNVTLHVGAGTFQPVKADYMDDHSMHAEFIEVSLDAINILQLYLNNHISVTGTTTLRTVESLYWLGVKTILQPGITSEDMVVQQWDPYELNEAMITTQEALSSLTTWMNKNNLASFITKTSLLIAPGYSFHVVHALITNFHQPQSTLLLLVAAFAGENWKHIYDYALAHDFRFLSYGDGCLLFRQ